MRRAHLTHLLNTRLLICFCDFGPLRRNDNQVGSIMRTKRGCVLILLLALSSQVLLGTGKLIVLAFKSASNLYLVGIIAPTAQILLEK